MPLGFLAPAGRGGGHLGNDLLLPFSPAGQRQQQWSLASIGRAPPALGRGPCTWLFASPFPSKAASQGGHQIDDRRRCADCSRSDGQPLHLRLDQLSQGLLVAVSVGARIKTPGPLRDDRLFRAAIVLGRFGEDIDAALALIDRTLSLNPSFAQAWYWSGSMKEFFYSIKKEGTPASFRFKTARSTLWRKTVASR